MAVVKKLDADDNTQYVSNDTPSVLYKFSPISKFTFEIFINRKIFMPSPASLNDPFDCLIPIRYDLLSDDEMMEFNLSFFKNMLGVGDDKARDLYDEANRHGEVKKLSRYEMIEHQTQILNASVRIFCLTRSNDNFLLWSHYAANHTGICIGYSTNHLYANTGASIGVVNYMIDIPQIKPTPLKRMNELIAQVLTKSKCWEYEEEYRLVYWENKPLFDIQPQAIREIIFGCRTSKSDIESVVNLIRNDKEFSHVNFYQVSKEQFAFKLVLNKLE
jgi:hypothetical protein